MKNGPFLPLSCHEWQVMGPKCLLIFSARDNLVKVSWKSDARKCQNQVTPPYFDQLRERCEPLWHFILKPLVKSQSCSQLHICQNWRPLKTEWNQGNNKTVGRNQWRRKSPNFWPIPSVNTIYVLQATLCTLYPMHPMFKTSLSFLGQINNSSFMTNSTGWFFLLFRPKKD